MSVQRKWFWLALSAVGVFGLLLAFPRFAPAQENASAGVQADVVANAVSGIAEPLASASRDLPEGELSEMSADPIIPEEFQDPLFGRYVNLHLLGQAWRQMDAGLLTDVACQLAEGERILLRPHKVFSADKLFEKAVRVATEKKDKPTLERLAKLADRQKNQALIAQVAGAQKLAGEARAADPALLVPVEETTPEEFASYRQLLDEVTRARIAGQRTRLDDLEAKLKVLEGLSKPQKEYLLRVISGARAVMPKDIQPDALSQALDKLSGESRGLCTKCSGLGRYFAFPNFKKCDRCDGTGRVPDPNPFVGVSRIQVVVIIKVGPGISRVNYNVDGKPEHVDHGRMARHERTYQTTYHRKPGMTIKFDNDLSGGATYVEEEVQSGTYIFKRAGSTLYLEKQSSSTAW